MIKLAQGFPENIVAVKCSGHVTRSDYEKVLIPAVDQALKAHEKVRLYYHVGADFEGIDPGAILEDMKVGFSHLSRWEKMAVVTDVAWIRHAIKAFAFLMPGELKFYSLAEDENARSWIAS
ncbi:MAG TPA: STAS/SEC14 domain-containing protein [Parvularculaceae bacterium]|nr:STAS/SEC14 domain-containing protein [Parvularculaceae bacterium]